MITVTVLFKGEGEYLKSGAFYRLNYYRMLMGYHRHAVIFLFIWYQFQ